MLNPSWDSEGTPLLTPLEFAIRLRVAVETVYCWLRLGDVRGVRAGRQWRIPSTELARILAGDASEVN
jgi:excisionase family DNA binding protein